METGVPSSSYSSSDTTIDKDLQSGQAACITPLERTRREGKGEVRWGEERREEEWNEGRQFSSVVER